MLRAIGMIRERLGRMIRAEAALAGAVIGTLVGLFLGIAIRALLASIGFAARSIPAASISMLFLLSVLAGGLAAALPARRASRVDVRTAIRGE
jgi:putative ABC transport system permease protein